MSTAIMDTKDMQQAGCGAEIVEYSEELFAAAVLRVPGDCNVAKDLSEAGKE